MHEHIQESLLPGRRTKAILLAIFTHFCRFFKGASAENLILTGKNDQAEPGKLLIT